MQQLNKEKIDEEDKEFKAYINKKEKLKKKRIKALFDSESRWGEVRQALNEMAVWNAFDNDIITKYLEYEEKCRKQGKSCCTVAEYVRKSSRKIHLQEQKELKKMDAMDKEKAREEEIKMQEKKRLQVE